MKKIISKSVKRMIADANANDTALIRVYQIYGCIGDFDDQYFSRIFQ